MTWALWLAASKLWEVTVSWKKLKYTYALRISSFLVKTENNNFIKEIKHVLRVFIAWWKPWQSLWKFSSRWKPTRVFTDLLSNSSKNPYRFSPGYEGTVKMYDFFLLNMQPSFTVKKSVCAIGQNWSRDYQ